MCLNTKTWDKAKSPPVPLIELNEDDQILFYIGTSEINNHKVYFVVSSNIIPDEQGSYIFSNNFIGLMA